MRMSDLNFLCQSASNAVNFTTVEKFPSRLDDRFMVKCIVVWGWHKVLKIMHLNQWAFKNVNDLGAT